MRKISLLGIILGGIVAFSATGVFGIGMGVYAAMKLDILHQTSQAHAQQMVREFAYSSPVMYFGGMAIGSLCSILGGWLSAFTAREAERLNGALSVLLMAGIHIWKFAEHKDPHSFPIQLIYVAALTAGASLGGWLRATQKSKRPSAKLASA